MDSSSSFTYKPLDLVKSEIRVVRIPPKDGDSLRLDTVCLDDNPTFAALSYVWGDPMQNQSFPVTKNLAAALKHIRRNWTSKRSPYRVQSLWVDAICINQQDPDERTQQVQLMSRIFKSAAVVLAWLGPRDHSLAYSTIKLLAREMYDGKTRKFNEEKLSQLDWLEGHPSLCSDDGPKQSGSGFRNLAWSSVATFMRDPYWTRVWIFQEVVLARKLLFISNGSALVSWPTLNAFQRGFLRMGKNIRKLSLPRPNYLSPSVWLAVATDLASVSIIQQSCFAREVFNDGSKATPTRDYSWLMLSFASRLKATDLRDYIYGLLAITAIPIVPDYNKTVSDVYIEYTAAWVDTCRDIGTSRLITPLGFLSHAGVCIYGSAAPFPSWALNFPGDGEIRISIIKMETGSADNGVFGDDSSKLPFVITGTKSLFAWGIEVDMVRSVAQGPVYGSRKDLNLLENALVAILQGERYKSMSASINAFFRLLHRDQSRTVSRSTIIRDLSLLYHMIKPLVGLEPRQRDQMLHTLRFSTDPVEFEARFRKCFAPGRE